jgi:hypothetical protein
MANTFATEGSAQVLICPDGTFVFDRKAVTALRLNDAHSISVCYSSASERFALQAIKANGCDRGVSLERKGDRLIAYCAADFLLGAGVLPGRPTNYDAQYYADLHTIVVRNIAITKKRRTA